MTAGMRARWFSVAAAAAAVAACGDNQFPVGEPLLPAPELTIVAHQDDDLLLMQPDLYDAVRRRTGVTSVYVTAGNANGGLEIAESRNAGLMAAYGSIVGDTDWSCGWIRLGTVNAEHCRLVSASVSLVFLNYPDGGKDGEATNSLLQLWEGKVTSVPAVARRASTYDRDILIRVITEIIDQTAPATLRTLDIASTHGHDHSDHLLVGALAVLAAARSIRDPELISYRGANIVSEPPNAHPALFDRSAKIFAHYLACASGCAPCGTACAIDQLGASQRDLLERRYAIGVRRNASGRLRLDGSCVLATRAGSIPALGDCGLAPVWQLDAHGRLRSPDGLCLDAQPGGEIIAGSCSEAGPGGRFFLDDEGHLWSGVLPAPSDDMDTAHLYCVGAAGGVARAGLCGAGRAPTWELARTMTATPRATATLTRTGRAVRIARFPRGPRPMVCAVETGARGLMCAPTTDGGGLLQAVRIDSPAAPLAIEPESLVLGDVDGDGLTDACGRDAGGLLCATAASGYQAARFSQALGGAGPVTPTDRSLVIAADGEICGLGDAGVVCVAQGSTAVTEVRSTWPDRHAALWITDLDGDHQPDWCAATPGGAACGLAVDRRLTTDGVVWSYAFDAVIESSTADGALPDTATAVLTDIDGDGRDDLCAVRGDAISCARSLRRGFGPRAPVARLPAGMIPTAVWAEPAEPAGEPRICAADATTIACTD